MFNVLLQPAEQPQTYKFSKEDTVNFHGQELAKSDYEALEQIARQYFNTSAEEYFQNSKCKEVCIENKRVVKLRIFGENLEKIPEQIQKLTQLQYLDLGNSHISKIENLEQITELQELSLWGNKISKIENLEQQMQLKTLELSYNQISCIENLEQQKQLQKLNLGNNLISKIENLEQQKQVLVLNFGDNQITKIENLENQAQLECLWLTFNQISKIENLEQQKQLQKLDISYNNISKIENLEQLTQLQTLGLWCNNIKKIENLKQQKQLLWLAVGGNPIRKDDPGLAELIKRKVEINLSEDVHVDAFNNFVEENRGRLSEKIIQDLQDNMLTKRFKLNDLKDSYDPKELVPEDISQKIAKAYNYIRCDKKLGEQYLEQSILGRKISGIIAHDKKAIESFSHPFYDLCQTVKKEGSKDVSKELNARVNKRKDKKKLDQQAEDCLKRIELYRSVNAFPEQLDYPEDWKK